MRLSALNLINLLRQWDGLDRWACGAIFILGAVFCYLVTVFDTTAAPGLKEHLSIAAAQTASPEYNAKLKAAAQLLAAGNKEKLQPLLDELIGGYPYQAEPFIFLADYHIRLQEPVAAMYAYHQALDLNMDYLEKKSPLYQGKKIKNTVREAEAQINEALAANTGDPSMLDRKEVYYMLRKLAGGCGD